MIILKLLSEEVFDFSKDFSSAYTIHGGMGEKKAWER
jgi:hypothetical protein